MKHFLVILGLTALVWLGVSMSERHEYPMDVRVVMTGFDTVRYAVIEADTALHLQVEMDGFNAAAASMLHRRPTVHISMADDQRTVSLDEVSPQLQQQLSTLGVRRVVGGRDSLHLRLAERGHRTFRVRLDSVDFSFTEQYGLYGEPRVSPATVTLYGADSVLATIDELQVAHAELPDISQTATYRLPLDPIWRRLGDVHTAATEVEVYLPVEPYVEREYTVAVEVDGADSSAHLRLYPDVATVRVWVAQRDLERAPEFRVAISYDDVLSGGEHLTPQLVQFPSWVRPRSVEPSEINCVVIR